MRELSAMEQIKVEATKDELESDLKSVIIIQSMAKKMRYGRKVWTAAYCLESWLKSQLRRTLKTQNANKEDHTNEF